MGSNNHLRIIRSYVLIHTYGVNHAGKIILNYVSLNIGECTGINTPFPYKRKAEFVIDGLPDVPFRKPSGYGVSQLKKIMESRDCIKIRIKEPPTSAEEVAETFSVSATSSCLVPPRSALSPNPPILPDDFLSPPTPICRNLNILAANVISPSTRSSVMPLPSTVGLSGNSPPPGVSTSCPVSNVRPSSATTNTMPLSEPTPSELHPCQTSQTFCSSSFLSSTTVASTPCNAPSLYSGSRKRKLKRLATKQRELPGVYNGVFLYLLRLGTFSGEPFSHFLVYFRSSIWPLVTATL